MDQTPASDDQHAEFGFGLLVAFDTDDPEFVRGVEVGMLWERLEGAPEGIAATIHVQNAEMLMRLAEAKGLPFAGEPWGDGEEWMLVTIGRPDD